MGRLGIASGKLGSGAKQIGDPGVIAGSPVGNPGTGSDGAPVGNEGKLGAAIPVVGNDDKLGVSGPVTAGGEGSVGSEVDIAVTVQTVVNGAISTNPVPITTRIAAVFMQSILRVCTEAFNALSSRERAKDRLYLRVVLVPI